MGSKVTFNVKNKQMQHNTAHHIRISHVAKTTMLAKTSLAITYY